MAAKAEDSKLSEETQGFLAEVKKGKHRKFVMLAKGSEIVSLIVYKKGSIEKFRKEAKESGKGQFYFGVVDGSGANLSFKLATADGFTSAPVKTAALKGFLSEGGFTCKPEFQIVAALPETADEDEVATQSTTDKASEPQGQSSEQPQLQSPAATVDSPRADEPRTEAPDSPDAADAKLKQQLLAILQKIVPMLKQAIAQTPARKDELLASVPEIKSLIASGQLDQAKQAVQALAKLLKEPPKATSQETGQSSIDGQLIKDWQQLRTKVIGNLRDLAKFVASTKAAQAAPAIIEIKAVIANLGESPDARAAKELVRYLEGDNVVADVCERAFDFRTPMLSILQRLTATNQP